MGEEASTQAPRPETDAKKSLPERVHEMYYRVFPGANCPVTGAEHSDDGTAHGAGGGESNKSRPVYNVYGQRIDKEAVAAKEAEERARSLLAPKWAYSSSVLGTERALNPANRMPAQPAQEMAPGQKNPISTTRQKSSIPKGGTDDESWVYPSPQMFFNALSRKGKANDVTEDDMDLLVFIHNNVNERTWARVQRWEQLYDQMFAKEEKHEPRLLHFRGRPHDLSPLARIRNLMGYELPFDRHDWVVDKGGRSMRYVIDYYDIAKQAAPGAPGVFIDVRPAVDSVPAVLLRARMTMEELWERVRVPLKPLVDGPQLSHQSTSQDGSSPTLPTEQTSST
nr:TPA_exp: holocytochrome c synthase [Chaetosphaeridium globosum]